MSDPDQELVKQIDQKRRDYILTANDMQELIEVIGVEENQGCDVTFTVEQLRAVIGDEEADKRAGVTEILAKENARRQSVRVKPTGKFVTVPFVTKR